MGLFFMILLFKIPYRPDGCNLRRNRGRQKIQYIKVGGDCAGGQVSGIRYQISDKENRPASHSDPLFSVGVS